MQKRICFCVVVAVLLSVVLSLANAQQVAPMHNIERFSIDNGLSQSSVQCLYIDSKGFLWVGTQDGLNRYDGYSFKVFRNQPVDSTSLCNNYIHSICEDSKGDLWIGTQDGLCRYNRAKDNFSSFRHSSSNTNTISADAVYFVYVDRADKVWVKTVNAVDCLDPNNRAVQRYVHYSDPFNYAVGNNDFCIH